jgi:hypothetical protein
MWRTDWIRAQGDGAAGKGTEGGMRRVVLRVEDQEGPVGELQQSVGPAGPLHAVGQVLESRTAESGHPWGEGLPSRPDARQEVDVDKGPYQVANVLIQQAKALGDVCSAQSRRPSLTDLVEDLVWLQSEAPPEAANDEKVAEMVLARDRWRVVQGGCKGSVVVRWDLLALVPLDEARSHVGRVSLDVLKPINGENDGKERLIDCSVGEEAIKDALSACRIIFGELV